MISNIPDCTLCTVCRSEIASRACACFRELKLLGNNCLSSHLTSTITTHIFIELSIALKFLTGELCLNSYLSKLLLENNTTYIESKVICRCISSHLYKYNILSHKSNLQKKLIGISNISDMKVFVSEHGNIFVCPKFTLDYIILYKIESNKCIELARLPHTESIIFSFYSSAYIYIIRKKLYTTQVYLLDRFNLSKNRWEKLQDLNNYINTSPIQVNDNLYFFRGFGSNVLVLNTSSYKVRALKIDNFETNSCNCKAVKIQNKIYLITTDYIQIYNTNLRKIHEIRRPIPYLYETAYNIVTLNSSIYLHNDYFGYIELDTSALHSYYEATLPFPFEEDANRYIYYPIKSTKLIMRYDVKLNSIHIINLERYLDKEFSRTSLCVLPTGEIFVLNWVLCYFLNPITFELTRLPNIPTLCSDVSLVYCNNHIYAFGEEFKNRKFAMRFSLVNRTWSKIANMLEERHKHSCVALGNNIYIICGRANTIEIYDTETGSYSMSSISLNYKHAIGIGFNERLYVINCRDYKVLNEELEVLEEIESDDYVDETYSSGNTVVFEGRIIYHNEHTGCVELVNVPDRGRGAKCFKV